MNPGMYFLTRTRLRTHIYKQVIRILCVNPEPGWRRTSHPTTKRIFAIPFMLRQAEQEHRHCPIHAHALRRGCTIARPTTYTYVEDSPGGLAVRSLSPQWIRVYKYGTRLCQLSTCEDWCVAPPSRSFVNWRYRLMQEGWIRHTP